MSLVATGSRKKQWKKTRDMRNKAVTNQNSASYVATFISCLLTLISSSFSVSAAEILLDDYKHGLSPKWEEKTFKGNTQYQVAREDGQLCIKASSNASASGLYYTINYDTKEYPILMWRWKVDHTLSKGDALRKAGDDYAARVYVVFPSWAFWRTKALNYIWANRLPQGEAVANPFTKNAMMIAVESGARRTGQWLEERRNVLEDYRRYFGGDPPKVGAIAIMTDTDNTGEAASAWYGPITILSGSSH
jgi:hypothetical protein